MFCILHTLRLFPDPFLFDHLIRLEEEAWGNHQAEGVGGLEINDQLKGSGLFGIGHMTCWPSAKACLEGLG